jgi:hypothetical protein
LGQLVCCKSVQFKVRLWREDFMCDIWSETAIIPVLKCVARKRLVETVIHWGH